MSNEDELNELRNAVDLCFKYFEAQVAAAGGCPLAFSKQAKARHEAYTAVLQIKQENKHHE